MTTIDTELSPQEEKVLLAIYSGIEEDGFSPTYRDITRDVFQQRGVYGYVKEYVNRLEQHGYIRRRGFGREGVIMTPRGEAYARLLIYRLRGE